MHSKLIKSAVLGLCLSVQSLALAAQSSVITEPTSIHRLYSDVDMRLSLAIKPNMDVCVASQCEANKLFDARVSRVGQQLAAVAYDLYPNLSNHVSTFQFGVVDKKVEGTASNAEGDIVVFRGLQQAALNDAALRFIIGREMGHVIGKHHTKNTSTKLIISAVASVVFPVAGIIAASSTATQASTVTSVVTSAASTATSLIGSKIAMVKAKPRQLVESDAYANSLLESLNQDYHLVVQGLPEFHEDASDWLNDLNNSKSKLQARVKMKDLETTLTMKTH